MRRIAHRSLFGMMFLALLGSLIVILGCGSGPSVIEEEETKETVVTRDVEYDMSAVITRGNRSFIPINKGGNPGDNPDMILGVMDAFEKAHPELTVTDWKIDNQQDSFGTDPKIFGIWVDHKPKSQ